MATSHADMKGAFGLELEDGKGGREMIDAPMLKQVRGLFCDMFPEWFYNFLSVCRRKIPFGLLRLQGYIYPMCKLPGYKFRTTYNSSSKYLPHYQYPTCIALYQII